MVAKIKTGRNINGAISYNEHKVRQGKAALIFAQGYLKDPASLSYSDKLGRLKDLTDRNARTQVNALHVSLNFAVDEHLDKETLQEISEAYMAGLGFGAQPYLVYQHHDAGHPHLHIVTTNIKPDGGRISFHLLANRASESARKKVERDFNLVRAEEQVRQESHMGTSLEPVNYGTTALKKTISHAVNQVIKTYRFTSIPELNAVLHQYNIVADRGAKDSRMYAKNGLLYWVLDEKGCKIGVPIKASSIYGKPILKNLQDRFRLNEMLRKPFKERLKTAIDQAFSNPVSMQDFQGLLHAQGIQVIFRNNEEGRLYGVTFIDHRSKTVFNGSDLGKAYSANCLFGKFATDVKLREEFTTTADFVLNVSGKNTAEMLADKQLAHGISVIAELFKEEQQDMSAIGRWQPRKRRKKRKGHSL